jgi:Transketolase, C-terminal subunit
MRNAFCNAMLERATEPGMVFFTGDLGFMALEPLQARMGARFINAGVAEQNMISVAAGVASRGEQCWTYSIAPFIFGRPFEQIRNDVCLHDFDVKMVGNGGGYGYGVMGGSHHALEDYGVLLALQNMRVYIPTFAEDLAPITKRMAADPHPGYLRLGRCETAPGPCPSTSTRLGVGCCRETPGCLSLSVQTPATSSKGRSTCPSSRDPRFGSSPNCRSPWHRCPMSARCGSPNSMPSMCSRNTWRRAVSGT